MTLEQFNSRIEEAYSLIRSTNDALTGSSVKDLTSKHVHAIVEISFLRVFVALERFLEDTFIEYMTSKKSGKAKTYLKNIDKDRAYDILAGTKPYPDWTKIEEVSKMADLFFVNGKPFSVALREIESEFRSIKSVRDAIVHMSKNAETKYSNLALKPNAIVEYISPGEFLNSTRKKEPRITYFEHYVSFLQQASEKIIQ